MKALFRPIAGTGALFLLAFVAFPAMAQAQAKGLKVHNATAYPVEYGVTGGPGTVPLTTVVVPPGGMRSLYVTPDRDYFWWRYRGDNVWSGGVAVPQNPDPVYRWRFTSGVRPGLVGAGDIPMFPFP